MLYGKPHYAGYERAVQRLVWGIDPSAFISIEKAKSLDDDLLWRGTQQDLVAATAKHYYEPQGNIPLRDAIDWTQTMVYLTIQMLKFSSLKPVCGGRVSIATIPTDDHFQWVLHESLDVAITRQEIKGGKYG